MECNCWVATKSEEERFGIRYGAHALECPAFQQSLDPVDAANDQELRERNELHIMDDDAEENAKRGLILRIM